MALRLMPLGHNVLTSDTLVPQTETRALCSAWLGFPPSNAIHEDMSRPVLLNGAVDAREVGRPRDIDFDEGGGELLTTPSSGYDPVYPRVELLCAGVAAGMNGVGTAGYQCYLCQDSTNRNRVVLYHPSVSFSLPIKTGTHAATNVLFASLGFRNADRASAQTHVGDYAVLSTNANLCQLRWEFAAAGGDELTYRAIQAVVLLGVNASPEFQVGYIDASDAAVAMPMDFDPLLMAHFPATTIWDWRFYLVLQDAASEDASRFGIGYVYAGPYYEPPAASNWSWRAMSLDTAARLEINPDISGSPFLSALDPGMRFAIEFSMPGLAPTEADAFASLIRSLGLYDRVIVALDPENEPNRETALCRVSAPPTLARKSGWSKMGRWTLRVEFEIQRW